jgi:hypothetical protein
MNFDAGCDRWSSLARSGIILSGNETSRSRSRPETSQNAHQAVNAPQLYLLLCTTARG